MLRGVLAFSRQPYLVIIQAGNILPVDTSDSIIVRGALTQQELAVWTHLIPRRFKGDLRDG